MQKPSSPPTPPRRKPPVLGRGLSALLGEVATEVPINRGPGDGAAQPSPQGGQAPAQGSPQHDLAAGRAGLQNTMAAALGATGAGDFRKYREVAVSAIVPNPSQPRKNFNNDKLKELVESLKQRGVIQPLLVRPHPQKPDHYEVVAGERRWRAAQLAGLHLVPVIVKELDNAQTLELALLENLHRDDLNAIETAEAFQRLIDEFHHSHESLATMLGRSRPALTNDLRLLTLPPEVKELIKIGKLSPAHGRNLIGVRNPEQWAVRVISEQWSVRRLEQEVKKWREGGDGPATKPKGGKDVDTRDLEKKLTKLVGLPVAIKIQPNKKSGAVAVSFADSLQLQTIITLLARR